MLRTTKLIGAAALGLLVGVGACHNDKLLRPASITPVDPLFDRYVSMGNSITAGFQSGGINDSTQLQSYANLLGTQMQSPFFMPLLNRPGCPPPIDSVFKAGETAPRRRRDGDDLRAATGTSRFRRPGSATSPCPQRK